MEQSLSTTDKNALREQLPEQLSKAQLVFIAQRTPPVFIKTRAGRGGQTFSYVEIGYVVKMLNSIFGFGGWDWEYTTDHQLSYPTTKQIVVDGKLTIKIFKDDGTLMTTIVKSASGGKDVSFPKAGGDPIDLGDDKKAASADALKKAASLLGIAEDVYSPSIYKAQEAINQSRQSPKATMSADEITNDVETAMEAEDPNERISLQRAIFGVAKELAVKGKLMLLGLKTDEERKQAIKDFLAQYAIKIESFSKDPLENLRLALNQLQQLNQ